MAIGCKNCGSHFTRDEIMRLKPPMHAWPLTEVGKRVLAENQSTGHDAWPCPTCGCRTLRG